jgi:ATP-dependent helicase HrpA
LPELLEITRGSGKQAQTLIGFPALVDARRIATWKFRRSGRGGAFHYAGLRRLFACR